MTRMRLFRLLGAAAALACGTGASLAPASARNADKTHPVNVHLQMRGAMKGAYTLGGSEVSPKALTSSNGAVHGNYCALIKSRAMPGSETYIVAYHDRSIFDAARSAKVKGRGFKLTIGTSVRTVRGKSTTQTVVSAYLLLNSRLYADVGTTTGGKVGATLTKNLLSGRFTAPQMTQYRKSSRSTFSLTGSWSCRSLIRTTM